MLPTMSSTTSPAAPAPASDETGTTLRLLWPQWQGATAANIEALFAEQPYETARLGYAVGSRVLDAVLPGHVGPTAVVPVTTTDEGLDARDGIEAKDAVLRQLSAANDVIAAYDPSRILTLGGECSVSVAPFAALASRYGEDLAVIWIDSHPDVGTPSSDYHGYHAMAVAVLAGHGDADVQALLPATVPAAHIALAGMHSWTEDDIPNANEWGIASFSPEDLRTTSTALLQWLRSTGCSRVAVHLDVDVVDSDEVVLGLGAETGGLSSFQVRRLVSDISQAADVVGLTIAEFIPRQVIALQRLVRDFPLLPPTSSGPAASPTASPTGGAHG